MLNKNKDISKTTIKKYIIPEIYDTGNQCWILIEKIVENLMKGECLSNLNLSKVQNLNLLKKFCSCKENETYQNEISY